MCCDKPSEVCVANAHSTLKIFTRLKNKVRLMEVHALQAAFPQWSHEEIRILINGMGPSPDVDRVLALLSKRHISDEQLAQCLAGSSTQTVSDERLYPRLEVDTPPILVGIPPVPTPTSTTRWRRGIRHSNTELSRPLLD